MFVLLVSHTLSGLPSTLSCLLVVQINKKVERYSPKNKLAQSMPSTTKLAALFSCCVVAAATSRTQQRPNVLFIVVDDLGVTTSNYGFPAQTPNLERLAARGTQFQRAFVSIAVCAPSRTAFLTGLRPDTTQVWTIDPYFRVSARGGQGMAIATLPQLFRQHGYRVTGAGKIFHPGAASGGVSSSEGGGDMCPADSPTNNCAAAGSPVGSWSEPYFFCDHYTNDTVQSPAMQRWPCAHAAWPSCGTGCVQSDACIACFEAAHTWGVNGIAWAAADCDDACYPEGLIADQAIATLQQHANASAAHREGRAWAAAAAADAVGSDDRSAAAVVHAAAPSPFFLAVGFKRPHLTYKAPTRFFDMYPLADVALPLHDGPSPSWPAIATSHSCVAGNALVEPYGVNRTCRADGMCSELVTNATVVRELRRAHHCALSYC